jgi:hypothetical protein
MTNTPSPLPTKLHTPPKRAHIMLRAAFRALRPVAHRREFSNSIEYNLKIARSLGSIVEYDDMLKLVGVASVCSSMYAAWYVTMETDTKIMDLNRRIRALENSAKKDVHDLRTPIARGDV